MVRLMSQHSGYTLRDMFDVPISLGSLVTLRFHTLQWGWVTVKGCVTGQRGDRVNVKIIDYSRATSVDPNERPSSFTPAASAVIVLDPSNHQ